MEMYLASDRNLSIMTARYKELTTAVNILFMDEFSNRIRLIYETGVHLSLGGAHFSFPRKIMFKNHVAFIHSFY
jgi:hypothetical protein